MDPIEELLGLLNQEEPLTEEQSARLNELITTMSDEELLEAETQMVTLFDELSDGDVDAETLVRLQAIAGAITATRTTANDRIETAEAEAAAAAEAQAQLDTELANLLNAVHGGDDDGDDPDDDDDEGGDTVVDDLDDPVDVDDPDLVPAGNTPPGSAPAPAAVRVATRQQIRQHTARSNRPEPRQTHMGRVTMRGAGGMAGEFAAIEDVERALLDRYRDLEGTVDHGRFRVATFATELPAAYRLPDGRITDAQDMVDEIRHKMYEPGGVESLVADGGICGPVDIRYERTSLAQATRPLRSSIAQYQSRRGGLRWLSSMTIADINSATTPTVGNAIGVVSESQDAASTYDKSYQTVTCGSETEKRVDAVYNQLKFGNFFDRTNPEGKAEFTELSIAAYARFSEQRLYNAMISNSTAVTAPQDLGATRDLITALNMWAINRRAQYRMPENARIDVVLPGWVGDGLIPDDQMRAMQSYPEQFDVNRAWLASKLAARNINVVNWFQDDFTTAVANGAPINAYPSTFKVIGFHPGAHVYIDQGDLNLGVVRDLDSVKDNTFNTFQEEFWTTGMWGVWSHAIRFSICANGASAGTVAPTCGS